MKLSALDQYILFLLQAHHCVLYAESSTGFSNTTQAPCGQAIMCMARAMQYHMN